MHFNIMPAVSSIGSQPGKLTSSAPVRAISFARLTQMPKFTASANLGWAFLHSFIQATDLSFSAALSNVETVDPSLGMLDPARVLRQNQQRF
jgi:hypothetical protein